MSETCLLPEKKNNTRVEKEKKPNPGEQISSYFMVVKKKNLYIFVYERLINFVPFSRYSNLFHSKSLTV